MATAEEIAKAIVGQWGYEEAGWWEPIKQALIEAYQRGREDAYECALGIGSPSYNPETVDVGGLPLDDLI